MSDVGDEDGCELCPKVLTLGHLFIISHSGASCRHPAVAADQMPQLITTSPISTVLMNDTATLVSSR